MNALDVDCPTCRAKVGVHCKRPSGHRVFGGGSHASRERLAEGHQTTGTLSEQLTKAVSQLESANGKPVSLSGKGNGFTWSMTVGSISVEESR